MKTNWVKYDPLHSYTYPPECIGHIAHEFLGILHNVLTDQYFYCMCIMRFGQRLATRYRSDLGVNVRLVYWTLLPGLTYEPPQ